MPMNLFEDTKGLNSSIKYFLRIKCFFYEFVYFMAICFKSISSCKVVKYIMSCFKKSGFFFYTEGRFHNLLVSYLNTVPNCRQKTMTM
jgi:hypothetical protein